ncbi:hypothetical protein R3P38DRAFT_2803447 [Favolaschia claudopus]|uniref:Uncharacterized protein n=1 Tax=Favolaschia claudopus TaxID=2862362 RepID=A0AAV9ZS52_9AGAR
MQRTRPHPKRTEAPAEAVEVVEEAEEAAEAAGAASEASAGGTRGLAAGRPEVLLLRRTRRALLVLLHRRWSAGGTPQSPTSGFAGPTTALTDATSSANTAMHAHFAERESSQQAQATAPKSALCTEMLPIVTPLKADRWAHWIRRLGLEEEWADVHFDHVFSFGACSAPGVFGRVADLFVLLLKLGFSVADILKWVDDFVFFRYPNLLSQNSTSYDYDESVFINLAADLGLPWEMDKHSPFHNSFTYLGFDWDLVAKSVALPDKKRIKYLAKLEPWTSDQRAHASRKEAENVVGTLNHCALVLPEGRSRLVSMYRFTASFNLTSNNFIRFSVPVKRDAAWWRDALSQTQVHLKIKEPPPPNADEIFVNASTGWGVGFVF